jgi:DNA-binding HxlR family transcriptional regulator
VAHRQPLCRVPRRLQRPSLGRSLLAIVEALITWSADHISDVEQARRHHDTTHWLMAPGNP